MKLKLGLRVFHAIQRPGNGSDPLLPMTHRVCQELQRQGLHCGSKKRHPLFDSNNSGDPKRI